MKDCIFCKIADGEAQSYKFWENDDFIAVLDIMPVLKGQALVISKKHHGSYAFNLSDEDYIGLVLAAKKAGKLMESKLKAERVILVIEGLDINHVHVKLFPRYPNGRGLMRLGSRAKDEDLKKLHKVLTS